MTCREFENLLGKPLSAEAQEHLRTCESCAKIAQWFAAEPTPTVPKIALPEPVPLRPLPSPWWIASALFALGGITAAIGGNHLGFAGWDALESTQRIAIFAGLAIIGAAASLLLARQMFPTLAKRVSPAICIAAALCAVIAGPLALMPWDYDAESFTELGIHCAEYGLMYSAAVMALTWMLIRRGYFLQPGWSGALAGLVSGSIALVVLETYCPLVERSHVLAWHGGVVAVSVVVSSVVAHLASKRKA
jgi:hypothetical protein